MKMAFPPVPASGESAVRPGFDVLLAVTAARQAASPTARYVVATRVATAASDGDEQRRSLLASGRAALVGAARFADVTPIPAVGPTSVQEVATEMNGLFTRAFQPMVKHGGVNPQDKAGYLGGTGPGME